MLYSQYDLAGMGGAFHQPVGFRRVSQGKYRMDNRPETAIFNERPHMPLLLRCQRLLKSIIPVAQGAAGNGDPLAHKLVDGELDTIALHCVDVYQPPVFAQEVDVFLEIRAADHLKDDIKRLSRKPLLKVARFIVHVRIRPKPQAGFAFFIGPYGNSDVGTKGMRKLAGGGADSACAAVHQQPFRRLQPAPLEYIGPNGKNGFRQ